MPSERLKLKIITFKHLAIDLQKITPNYGATLRNLQAKPLQQSLSGLTSFSL